MKRKSVALFALWALGACSVSTEDPGASGDGGSETTQGITTSTSSSSAASSTSTAGSATQDGTSTSDGAGTSTTTDAAETGAETEPGATSNGDASSGAESLGAESSSGTSAVSEGGSDGSGDAGDAGTDTDGGECRIGLCQGKMYACGDCLDNDDDGVADAADPDCWGPCDNNEAGWRGNVPGQQNSSECSKMDCYFDQDGGSGNDDCFWSQSCDPLEPTMCTYDAATSTPGTTASCSQLNDTQSDLCTDYCGPLTPNGCDCFGCCDIYTDTGVHTVYIGSENELGQGTCSAATAGDPSMCQPCTQVEACLKPCDPQNCQICLGMTEVPEGCGEAACPDGIDACDPQNGHADCQDGWNCITGCCFPPPG